MLPNGYLEPQFQFLIYYNYHVRWHKENERTGKKEMLMWQPFHLETWGLDPPLPTCNHDPWDLSHTATEIVRNDCSVSNTKKREQSPLTKKNTNSYLILKLETTTAWIEARQKFVCQSLLDLGSWDTDNCSWSLQVSKDAECWAVQSLVGLNPTEDL